VDWRRRVMGWLYGKGSARHAIEFALPALPAISLHSKPFARIRQPIATLCLSVETGDIDETERCRQRVDACMVDACVDRRAGLIVAASALAQVPQTPTIPLTMDGSVKVVIVPDHATWLRIPLAPAPAH
jgi:hypothetical protein